MVTWKHRTKDGKVVDRRDWLGGIFEPVPGKQTIPAYTWGPKQKGGVRTNHVYQCPVSAIPVVVWDLLWAWFERRLMRLPVDRHTPLSWSSFVVFEGEMQAIESRRGAVAAEQAASMAVGAMVKVMGR